VTGGGIVCAASTIMNRMYHSGVVDRITMLHAPLTDELAPLAYTVMTSSVANQRGVVSDSMDLGRLHALVLDCMGLQYSL